MENEALDFIDKQVEESKTETPSPERKEMDFDPEYKPQYDKSKYLVKETSTQGLGKSQDLHSYWDDERIKGAFNFGNGSWKDMKRYMDDNKGLAKFEVIRGEKPTSQPKSMNEDALKVLKSSLTEKEWNSIKDNKDYIDGYLSGKYQPKELKNAAQISLSQSQDELTDDELKEELVDNKYFYENARDEDEVAKWLGERMKISPERAKAFVQANYKGGEIWSDDFVKSFENEKPKLQSKSASYDPALGLTGNVDETSSVQKVVDDQLKKFGRIGGGMYDELDQKGYYLDENNKVRRKDEIRYDKIVYPKGTSKEYTEKVNAEYKKALPILEKYGIKLEDFGGHTNDRGGYEDNSKEIMDKYVFEPFRKKYPNGNNAIWEREYKPLYEAIDAVLDKNYNDWWIRNK